MTSPSPGIDPLVVLQSLASRGVTSLAGVPCSSMTGLIDAARRGEILPYANAPNEGEALAYAAGIWLGGGLGAILCQNSGLGNLYNCLTSLCIPYAIPSLILCGWRGFPGAPDEPQHRAMGKVTRGIFNDLGIIPSSPERNSDLRAALVDVWPDKRETAVLLIRPGAMTDYPAELIPRSSPVRGELRYDSSEAIIGRREAVDALSSLRRIGTGVVASTGLLSREIFAAADGADLFCMAGSMGHAATLGLAAHAQSGIPMLVVEGDGSLLMRPQAMAFIGSEAPTNFCHVVLDNGVHESTGGQPSLAATADLAAAAVAFGYRTAVDCADPSAALSAAELGLRGGGPVFVRLRIKPGGAIPPRIDMDLQAIALRFRKHIGINSSSRGRGAG